jgi:hypothetical protein
MKGAIGGPVSFLQRAPPALTCRHLGAALGQFCALTAETGAVECAHKVRTSEIRGASGAVCAYQVHVFAKT